MALELDIDFLLCNNIWTNSNNFIQCSLKDIKEKLNIMNFGMNKMAVDGFKMAVVIQTNKPRMFLGLKIGIKR